MAWYRTSAIAKIFGISQAAVSTQAYQRKLPYRPPELFAANFHHHPTLEVWSPPAKPEPKLEPLVVSRALAIFVVPKYLRLRRPKRHPLVDHVIKLPFVGDPSERLRLSRVPLRPVAVIPIEPRLRQDNRKLDPPPEKRPKPVKAPVVVNAAPPPPKTKPTGFYTTRNKVDPKQPVFDLKKDQELIDEFLRTRGATKVGPAFVSPTQNDLTRADDKKRLEKVGDLSVKRTFAEAKAARHRHTMEMMRWQRVRRKVAGLAPDA